MPDITPVSAAPAKPLTAEDKRQRIADLRKRMGKSQIEVIAPAGKRGYWVRKDDTQEYSRLEYLGFSIVHDNPSNPVWKAAGAQADGTYVLGDVILMECDEELYELIQQEYVDRNLAQRSNAQATFKEEAETQGVPVFEMNKPRR